MTEVKIVPILIYKGIKPKYIKLKGNGILAGEYPDWITMVEGVPAPCEVRVLVRSNYKGVADGMVIASVMSGHDGTWIVRGLNPELAYDVVSRHAGYNDMILSNVHPVIE